MLAICTYFYLYYGLSISIKRSMVPSQSVCVWVGGGGDLSQMSHPGSAIVVCEVYVFVVIDKLHMFCCLEIMVFHCT